MVQNTHNQIRKFSGKYATKDACFKRIEGHANKVLKLELYLSSNYDSIRIYTSTHLLNLVIVECVVLVFCTYDICNT